MNINDFKKNRNIQDLIANIKKSEASKGGDDPRFWKPTLDKEKGSGSAVIRFLPKLPTDKGADFIKRYKHGFKSKTGNWLIENCPTTMAGEGDTIACPICDLNKALWATELKSDRDLVSEQKRNLSYVANILVIRDPAKPECNGKNFLYEFGPRIYDHYKNKLMPKFEGQESIDAFNPWTGANFVIKALFENKQWNYNLSEWEPQAELFPGDDAKKLELFKKLHSLDPFVAKASHKSYVDLASRLVEVVGDLVGSGISVRDVLKLKGSSPKVDEDDVPTQPNPAARVSKPVEEPKKEVSKPVEAPRAAVTAAPSSDEDDLDLFKTLANS